MAPHSRTLGMKDYLLSCDKTQLPLHSAFTAARSEIEKLVHTQPANEIPLSVFGTYRR